MQTTDYTKGYVAGALAYARTRGDSGDVGANAFLQKALSPEAYGKARTAQSRVAKDYRIGHLCAPRTDDSPFFHASMNNIYQFQVIDVHPSGHNGVECRDGVLELATYFKGNMVGQTIFTPADEWCVA